MESDMVAQLWGMARKNANMNYEKMSRGMRYVVELLQYWEWKAI